MAHLYTPHGRVNLEREVVDVPPAYLDRILLLADTTNDIQLGLHCTRCQQDVRGANRTSDGLLRMECGCRTFVGRNPRLGGPS